MAFFIDIQFSGEAEPVCARAAVLATAAAAAGDVQCIPAKQHTLQHVIEQVQGCT